MKRNVRAMTLVELLVVITVILVLMAVAIPLSRNAIREGGVREASRQLNTYLALAKARAAQRGQRVGVAFLRPGPGANGCIDLFMVDEPLPYSGDVADARVKLTSAKGINSMLTDDRVLYGKFELTDSAAAEYWSKSAFFKVLVSEGDRIRFNHRGPYYRVTKITETGAATSYFEFAPNAAVCGPGDDQAWGVKGADDDSNGAIDDISEAYWLNSDDTAPVLVKDSIASYQVYRQPKRSTVKPLQIQNGACIDLEWSGIGASGVQFAATSTTNASGTFFDGQPVVVMFEPGGTVSSVVTGGFDPGATVSTPRERVLDGPLFFLLGRFEQATPAPPATSTAELFNIKDAASVWVMVSDRNGAVASAENDPIASDVAAARILVRAGQTMGGR